MSGIDIRAIMSGENSWIIIVGVVIFIGVVAGIAASRSKTKAILEKERPEGTDIKLAERKHERNSSPDWRDIPAVINSETIASELGWPLERYKTYLDVQKRELLRAASDFGDKLYPEELILRWLRPPFFSNANVTEAFQIALTDKRVLYKKVEVKDEKLTLRDFFNHWYANIVEVKPEWVGDLGSHIEGGGGFVSRWVWESTGGAWGQQNSIQTVQHHVDCYVTIREQNGSSQKFPFPYIKNQHDLDTVKDFIAMLNKLVDLAWKRSYREISPARVEVPARNPKLIKTSPSGGANNTLLGEKGETGDFDKRVAVLEKYGALREKGLITEEEYNQQKKKLLG